MITHVGSIGLRGNGEEGSVFDKSLHTRTVEHGMPVIGNHDQIVAADLLSKRLVEHVRLRGGKRVLAQVIHLEERRSEIRLLVLPFDDRGSPASAEELGNDTGVQLRTNPFLMRLLRADHRDQRNVIGKRGEVIGHGRSAGQTDADGRDNDLPRWST